MKTPKCPKCGNTTKFTEIQTCTYKGFFLILENGERDYFDNEFCSVDAIDGYQCTECGEELSIDP
jgi:ABC-type ATPase with predicted acetyltransferase domain